MNQWSRLIFCLFIIFILSGCQFFSMGQKRIKINNQILTAEVAETVSQMTKGLSGRKNLDKNAGMLFVYPDYQIRYFHMKDMKFPLDIIWIKDEIIVGIKENVPVLTADGQVSRVQSNQPVNRVLEVNSDWVDSHNIKIGDKIIGLD